MGSPYQWDIWMADHSTSYPSSVINFDLIFIGVNFSAARSSLLEKSPPNRPSFLNTERYYRDPMKLFMLMVNVIISSSKKKNSQKKVHTKTTQSPNRKLAYLPYCVCFIISISSIATILSSSFWVLAD